MQALSGRFRNPLLGVTIYDIASAAGVSIATVSRVFNGHPRVSCAARDQVMEVADRLGYQPHVSARSLARRRANVVAAVIPMLTNLFFVDVLRGLQDRMAESEFDLLVFSARTLDEVDVQLDRALARGRAAGVLVFSTPLADARARRLGHTSQPVVLVDSVHPDFDSVSTDNVEGGRLAARHLLETGARRLALLMAHPDSIPASDRKQGFTEVLDTAGLDADSLRIVHASDPLHHGYSEAAGYDAMKRLLHAGDRPDAVFATSDVQALGALEALATAGLGVPDDMRLMGFDDIMLSRHVGLTTVRQPMYELGRLAAERLVTRIDDPDREPAHTVLSPRLVVRGTTVDTTVARSLRRIQPVAVS